MHFLCIYVLYKLASFEKLLKVIFKKFQNYIKYNWSLDNKSIYMHLVTISNLVKFEIY
jgi:hypothetical protein